MRGRTSVPRRWGTQGCESTGEIGLPACPPGRSSLGRKAAALTLRCPLGRGSGRGAGQGVRVRCPPLGLASPAAPASGPASRHQPLTCALQPGSGVMVRVQSPLRILMRLLRTRQTECSQRLTKRTLEDVTRSCQSVMAAFKHFVRGCDKIRSLRVLSPSSPDTASLFSLCLNNSSSAAQ